VGLNRHWLVVFIWVKSSCKRNFFTREIPAAVKISRPDSHTLVISERRLPAFLGVFVCLGILTVFYFTFPGFSKIDLNALFFLLPVLLAPYIVRSIRTLASGQILRFDANTRTVTINAQRVAAFDDVQKLQIRPVNGICEELLLSALLADGTRLDLHTSDSVVKTVALAAEIGEFLGVAIVWDT